MQIDLNLLLAVSTGVISGAIAWGSSMAKLRSQEETIKELSVRLQAVETEHSRQIASVIQTINDFKIVVIEKLTRLETTVKENR
jgi:hypothetical protein